MTHDKITLPTNQWSVEFSGEKQRQAVEREAAVPGGDWERTQLARTIESVLLRRAYKGELDGHTLNASYECADAVLALRPPQPGVVTEELRKASEKADPGSFWVNGDTADLYVSLKGGEHFLGEQKLIGRFSCGESWIRNAVFFAEAGNFVRSLLASPSPGASVTAPPAGGDDDPVSIAQEAYQTIGALASSTGVFEHPEVQRALDYFSGDEHDGKFLPFIMDDATPSPADGDVIEALRGLLSIEDARIATGAFVPNEAAQRIIAAARAALSRAGERT